MEPIYITVLTILGLWLIYKGVDYIFQDTSDYETYNNDNPPLEEYQEQKLCLYSKYPLWDSKNSPFYE